MSTFDAGSVTASARLNRQLLAKDIEDMRADLKRAEQNSISIDVGLDTARVKQQMSALRTELEREGNVDITLNADIQKFKREVNASLMQMNPSLDVKLNLDAAAFREKVKAAVDGSTGNSVKVKLDLDSGSLREQVRVALAGATGGQNAKIQLGIDAEDLRIQVQVALASATGGLNTKIKLGIDTDDLRLKVIAAVQSATAGTDADIPLNVDPDHLRTEVTAAVRAATAGQRGDVDIRTDDHGSFAKTRAEADGANGSIGALVSAIYMLAPALIPVGAAAVVGLGAIAPLAAAAAGGLGVLFLGFSGIIKATTDFSAAQKDSGAAGEAMAKAQSAAADQVASAQQAISNAVESAANSAINSQQALMNAQRGVTDAQRSAVSGVISALQSQQNAEKALTQAQQQQKDAQEALTAARKTAAQQMEDLTTRVEDGALSQRQANLSVISSKEALDAVLANPASSMLQRQQAQLTYDQAVQQVKDLGIQQGRLAEQKAQSDAAGVAGSQVVISATKGVAAANDGVATAQEQLGASAAAVAEAQRAGAEQVSRAQEALTNAVRAQGLQAQQSQQSIESAQRSLVAAQRAAQDASTSADSAAQKSAASMAALTPAGQNFVKFITNTMMPALSGLKATAQSGLLPGVQAGLESLLPVMPQINHLVGTLSTAMGDLFRSAGQALTNPFWTKFFTWMDTTAGPIIRTFGQTMGNLMQGFAGLTMAFQPFADIVGNGMLHLSEKFANFAANTGASSGFQSFMRYCKENGPLVAEVFGKIWGAVTTLIEGLAPFGTFVVKMIGWIADWMKSLGPTGLLGAIAAVTVALAIMTDGWTMVVPAITAVTAFFIKLYDSNKSLHDFVQDHLLPVVRYLGNFFTNELLPVLKQIGEFIGSTFLKAWDDMAEAYNRNKVAVDFLVKVLGEGLKFELTYLGGLISGLIWVVKAVVVTLMDMAGVVVRVYNNVATFVNNLSQLPIIGDLLGHVTLPLITGGLGDMGGAAGKAGTDTGKLKDKLGELKTAQDQLKSAIDGAISSFTVLNKTGVDVSRTQQAAATAEDTLRKALQGTNVAMSDQSAQAVSNRAAVAQYAEAQAGWIDAQFRSTAASQGYEAALKQAQGNLQVTREHLLNILDPLHQNTASTQAYIDTILKTPQQAQTEFMAKIQGALDNIARLLVEIAHILDPKWVNVDANIDPAIVKLMPLSKFLDDLTKPRTLDINAGPLPALPGVGSPITPAYGGIFKYYASGGFEDHAPQIAAASNSYRVWAEPETKGEAYIPLAADRRSRSIDIWRQTGSLLGVDQASLPFTTPAEMSTPGAPGEPSTPGNAVPDAQPKQMDWAAMIAAFQGFVMQWGGLTKSMDTSWSDVAKTVTTGSGDIQSRWNSVQASHVSLASGWNTKTDAMGSQWSALTGSVGTGVNSQKASLADLSGRSTDLRNIIDTHTTGMSNDWAVMTGNVGRNDANIKTNWLDLQGAGGVLHQNFDTNTTGISTKYAVMTGNIGRSDENIKTNWGDLVGALGSVQGSFAIVTTGIGSEWDRLRGLTAVPINFVIDTVINKGLFPAWGQVAGMIGGGFPSAPAPLPIIGGFAEGGVLPGYSPGVDNHIFTSPTGGQIRLSGGEAFMRPEWTRAVGGASAVDAMNAAAKNGTLAEYSGGGVYQSFAGGGTWEILDSIRANMFPGSSMVSGLRFTDEGYHSKGQAIDIGWPGNAQSGLMPIADGLMRQFPAATEIIHNPNGSRKDGVNVPPSFWGEPTWSEHADHVHWAMTLEALGLPQGSGSTVIPGGAGGRLLKDVARGIFDAAMQGTGTAVAGYPPAPPAINAMPPSALASIMDGTHKAIDRVAGDRRIAGGRNNMGVVDTRPGSPYDIFWRTAAQFGWDKEPYRSKLDSLEMQEAGYDPTAQNPISTAYGMGQFMDFTWPQYGPKTSDPGLQSLYMMRYIMDRYVDPIAARKHEDDFNWYDNGGVAAGTGYMYKDTIEPERVLSAQQTKDFENLIPLLSVIFSPTSGLSPFDTTNGLLRDILLAINRVQVASTATTTAVSTGTSGTTSAAYSTTNAVNTGFGITNASVISAAQQLSLGVYNLLATGDADVRAALEQSANAGIDSVRAWLGNDAANFVGSFRDPVIDSLMGVVDQLRAIPDLNGQLRQGLAWLNTLPAFSFDSGGVLPPGLSLNYNGIGQDEYVSTGAQVRSTVIASAEYGKRFATNDDASSTATNTGPFRDLYVTTPTGSTAAEMIQTAILQSRVAGKAVHSR